MGQVLEGTDTALLIIWSRNPQSLHCELALHTSTANFFALGQTASPSKLLLILNASILTSTLTHNFNWPRSGQASALGRFSSYTPEKTIVI